MSATQQQRSTVSVADAIRAAITVLDDYCDWDDKRHGEEMSQQAESLRSALARAEALEALAQIVQDFANGFADEDHLKRALHNVREAK